VRNYNVLKIAPAFLLLGTMLHAQQNDTVNKETEIEQVVLIGYGAKKKSDLTGSIVAVSEKDFNKGAIVSADQLITGKTPGVRITNAGGQPDSTPNIRIRGGASLSAQNNPLIVIDGVPLDSYNPAGVSNPLNLINPNDIESFSVLKDASATAIYGSRASNGVIIIKTKSGSKRMRVNFNTNVSIGEVTRFQDVMGADDYVRFISEYFPDYIWRLGVDGKDAVKDDQGNIIAPAVMGKLYDTNWQKAVYRTSVSHDNNLSITGNLFNKVPSRLSLGYNRTEGVVRTNDYERYSASLKLTPSFLDNHLKIDVNAKGLYSTKNAIDDGASIGAALNMDPTKPIYETRLGSPYNRFGGYYQNSILNGNQYRLTGNQNPLAALLQRERPENVYKFLGNIEVDYKMHFLPELRAVLNLGLEASKSDIVERYFENAAATYRNPNGSAYPNDFVFNPGINFTENQNIVNKTLDAYFVYDKKMNGFLSNFLFQAGYSYQDFRNRGRKEEFRYNDSSGLREMIINDQNPTNKYFNPLNLQSFIARSNIDFKNRYLFTLSARYDGSSLFTKDNRWGIFPAAAFAWKLNEESFLNDNKVVQELKLRLGWGLTGQQDVTQVNGFFPSRPLFQPGNASSQYLPGFYIYNALAFNPDLTWEKTETLNAGIDFTIIPSISLTGSVDVYKRDTKDLLAKLPLAPGQGLSNEFIGNVGEMTNHGVEINLGATPIKNQNFEWSVGTNFSYNYGKVTNLDAVNQIPGGGGLPVGTGVQLAYHTVGQQPYSAWVFQQIYGADGRPIAGAFVDRNGDGVISDADRYYTALRPNWTYGFNTNFNYKAWDFSANFRGQIGGKVHNARKLAQGFLQWAVPQNESALRNVLNFYNGSADSNITNLTDEIYYSDYYLEDATFLRLDNVTLGYKFSKIFGNTDMRVYASVNNAFIISKYDGMDPENFDAIDNNFYPRPRVYTLGLNFNF